MRVLVTGGTGYLGQFLVAALSQQHEVSYTYLRNPLESNSCNAKAFHVDLSTGHGMWEAVAQCRPGIVVNCAALSQPAACEQDYQACRALNCPSKLVEALQQLRKQHGTTTLLIHLSTDQVYNGGHPWWSEEDEPDPINAYGRSKLEAEQLLQEQWPGAFVALRSSLIYGPMPPLAPVDRPLFLQFVQQVLQDGRETTFFVDEYRCAIYVQDIVGIVGSIIDRASSVSQSGLQANSGCKGCVLAQLDHCIYNMGGPERLSRHDIALAVAQHCGLDSKAVLAAKSADVKRGYCSPLDISMKMDRLLHDLPRVVLTPLRTALATIFPAAGGTDGHL